jgi:hypothetical protein
MLIHRILDNTPFGPTDVEAMAQAFEAICLTLNITRADERDLVARKVINCATLGTLNRQDICKKGAGRVSRPGAIQNWSVQKFLNLPGASAV